MNRKVRCYFVYQLENGKAKYETVNDEILTSVELTLEDVNEIAL
jgi:hypothetical protein